MIDKPLETSLSLHRAADRVPPEGTPERVSKRTLLLLHWFLYSIGLTGIIYGLSWKLHAVLLARRPTTEYNEWALPFFFPDKPQQLIFFIAAGGILFLYYVVVYFLMEKPDEGRSTSYTMAELWRNGFILLYLVLPVSVNAVVVACFPAADRPRLPFSSYLLIVFWLSGALLPFYPPFGLIKERLRQVNEKFWQVTEILNQHLHGQVALMSVFGLVLFSFAQLLMICLPFLRGELLMMNEYLDIPEYTWLGGEYIANTEYINSHNLGGLLKYNPDVNHGASALPRPGTFVELPKTELLRQFIETNTEKYFYNEMLGALVVQGPMTADERTELSAIVDHDHSAGIISLYYSSREQTERLTDRIYSAEEKEFLSKNRLEMHWQILNRWVIHHHNFVLGPINEYALGKPLKDINIQYGAFNIVLMKYILEKTGGISYQNYFQKWYTVWPLYYVLFVGLTFLLFRDVYYVALVCLLAFGFVNKIDYQFLFLGPGLNPIRHFFDIPVIACLYLYFRNGKTSYLIVGSLLGVISVLNNQQFGLFLVGSFFVTMLIKTFQERSEASLREIMCASMALVASGVVMRVGNLGTNEMTSYFLEGFLGNMIDPNRLILMMLVISACYLALVRWEKTANELKYIALFLLVYSQGVLIYYTWGGDDKHLFNVASILALGGAAFIKLVIDHSSVKRYEKVLVGSLIALTLMVVYIPGLLSYYSTRHEYESIFLTHKTYDWNLDTAKFRSTMNPKYFIDSIALIQEYAPSENAIHLISKYDNFLPFLAKKYSAMPFFDLQWFLLTDKEVQLCIERIKTQKPHYLFIDTDIERGLNGEIVTADLGFISGPAGESLMRVQRLNLLKDIFAAVKDDYQPVKRGILLTVYERKAHG
jgi:hypothetical protein